MNLEQFKSSLNSETMPGNRMLQALWHDGRGEWEKAHNVVQDLDTHEAAWIHAYLHRKEGDAPNAGYWYQRARKPFPTADLNDEWEELVSHFLLQV